MISSEQLATRRASKPETTKVPQYRRNLFRPYRGQLLVFLTLAGLFILFAVHSSHAGAQPFKVEALLIWGTNESKSPDPKHKPVSDDVRRRLKDLPLKWSYYFEVNRKIVAVDPGSPQKEQLSKDCAITVKQLGGTKVEVLLFGKGQQVVKQSQDLPLGETLVVGGNAPNETAWLVLLKRMP